MRFVLWNNHQREWFKIRIIGFFGFLVLLPTTKQISKKKLGFGNPGLFRSLLGKGVQLYIDGTFKIVPDPFYQCLIIMAFDNIFGVYTPVLYILMTAKTYWLYWHALHWVIVSTKCRLGPFSVACNFDRPLHNAVREQCKNVIINGCVFHWKQAFQREMKAKDIGIRDE